MKIKQQICDSIKQHAYKDNPVEACGYLAGKNELISEIYPMKNADQSPEHFSFDPEEQFGIIKKARSRGNTILGCYHSHPYTPARMSEEDIRLAFDPDMVYVIYSLSDDTIKAFKVNGGEKPLEVELEVLL